MTIDELIADLAEIRKEYGDVEVEKRWMCVGGLRHKPIKGVMAQPSNPQAPEPPKTPGAWIVTL